MHTLLNFSFKATSYFCALVVKVFKSSIKLFYAEILILTL